ncbi:GAF domain-containing protein [Hydrotalea sandarakina]|jgi:GAF domain-containing protein|uniref:GAF domain-containing protein n=1 Tax=Hydrotalea sandarakina TaxID=1004304 RepID=A0A2W7RNF0_9BACT|nr:GAF domain-containing protein [Hydrotalea sandarakina]PZX61914.1 GAF domain-containing protein [Hydrotalea sandarakina]
MSENFIKATGNKQQQYNNLLPQIAGIVEGETDLIANLANITAMLKEQFNWLWVGFYWVKENMLVLGPFQGPIACTRIQKGKGVCGTAWQQANTVIVPDVNAFPGHIACSSLSQSEIVVPIIHKGEVVGVLDVDADTVNQFDETDKLYLEQIVQLIPLP